MSLKLASRVFNQTEDILEYLCMIGQKYGEEVDSTPIKYFFVAVLAKAGPC